MGQQIRKKEIRQRRKRYEKSLKKRRAERIAGLNKANPGSNSPSGTGI